MALLVTLFGLYSLVASRERPWVDARIMYEVAEQIVASHRVDIRTEWSPMSHKGPDGRVYSIYGLLSSLPSLHGRLAQIRSVRLCWGSGAWAKWRQANWASDPTCRGESRNWTAPASRISHS